MSLSPRAAQAKHLRLQRRAAQRRVLHLVPHIGLCFTGDYSGQIKISGSTFLLCFGAVAGAAIWSPLRGLNPLCLAPLRSAAKGRFAFTVPQASLNPLLGYLGQPQQAG